MIRNETLGYKSCPRKNIQGGGVIAKINVVHHLPCTSINGWDTIVPTAFLFETPYQAKI